ncbi:lipid-A-disaccharide synthase [Penaeicola halotolerans]|uniref:lipid-A-disaccharide synthase n=1 Tax=Penaeicola halotolerans TaxID=2793196 RepID=UPI001CF90387|nr:lipid-A-disaccharide synthase [Penaeicola halotolerans]
MKYYIIAGERSGDLHGSNLAKELFNQDTDAEIIGMGGDFMAEAGVSLHFHYKDIAVMGFWEVLVNIRKVKHMMDAVKRDLLRTKPDVLVLIDFGGFNMKMAAFAKSQGIRVHYYISPKVWAWNTKRAWKLKEIVDRMFVILPFEKDFFQQFDWEVDYVGNPLLDAIRDFTPHDFFYQKNELNYKPIIALLPGSREQEVLNMLKPMLSVIKQFDQFQFVLAGVKNLDDNIYASARRLGINVIYDQTYDLLHYANAALVTSGTATLETALFGVPQIVCYKTSPLSYQIGKRVIKVPYISLVNLIADKPVVKELIQDELNAEQLSVNLRLITADLYTKGVIAEGYQEIKEKLGNEKASQKLARLIIEDLSKVKA